MLGFGLSRLLPGSLRPSIVKTAMSAIERHKAGLVQRRFDRMAPERRSAHLSAIASPSWACSRPTAAWVAEPD